MFFYVMLTIAGVITAAILVWVLKSVSEAGRTAYRTLSPSSRRRSSTRLAHLNRNLVSAPNPWGWGSPHRDRPTVKSYSESSTRHSPVPRLRDREPPTLTSKTLRPSNIELIMQGIKDPSPIGSARNVLTGYDLSKRDPSKAATQWPYRAQGSGQGSRQEAVRSAPDSGQYTDARIADAAKRRPAPQRNEDRKDERTHEDADQPWGW